MTVPINTPSKTTLAGNTDAATKYTTTYTVFDATHVDVYKNGVKVTSGVTTTIAAHPTHGKVAESVFASGQTASDVILLIRNVPYNQEQDFINNSVFDIESLERGLDQLTMQTQQLDTKTDGTIKFADSLSGATAFDSTAEAAGTITTNIEGRKGKALIFHSTSGDLTLSDTSFTGLEADISSLAAIEDDIVALAAIGDEIEDVAGDATDIGVVAGKATEIGRLGTADAVADLALLGTDAIANPSTGDLKLVADIHANVTKVADIDSEVTAVAGLGTDGVDVTTVSNIGTDGADVTTVAGKATEIGRIGTSAMAASIALIGTTGYAHASTGDIKLVADIAANVTTVADNVVSVNSFGETYKVAGSAPGGPSEGDLWYDTGNDVMKVYNSATTAWVALSAVLPQGLGTSDTPTFTQIKLTGGSPGLDKVLTSDADGLATWEVNATPPIVTSLDYPGDDTALDTVGEFNLDCTTQTTTTVLAASTTGIVVGHVVKGAGIPISPVPTVVSIITNTSFVLSGAATASSGTPISLTFNTQTLVITGSNFTETLTSVTSAGTTPSIVTRDSATQITLTGFPTKAAGTYADGLIVTNSTGLTGNINVDYSALPGWSSPASGTVLTAFNGAISTIDLVGGSPTTSYLLASGSLPPGLGMHATTGDVTGTMSGSAATYNFTVDAIDAQAQSSPRLFNIISKGAFPTGGTIIEAGSYTGDYRSHTFFYAGNDSATNIFTPSGSFNIDYLVVAGGGGGGHGENSAGGDGAGGGGAGGFLTVSSFAVTAQIYTITVGIGGLGGTVITSPGTNGGNSIISPATGTVITATGGGGGGSDNDDSTVNVGVTGGSGGGTANRHSYALSGGTATVSPAQGNDGGVTYTNSAQTFRNGSGGGGAGDDGGDETSTVGGAGGPGLANLYRDGSSGSTAGFHIFAGGGGGGGGGSSYSGGGAGGTGGGGKGGEVQDDTTIAVAGTANTGSGGGGGKGFSSSQPASAHLGGAGGTGIVIIRYAI